MKVSLRLPRVFSLAFWAAIAVFLLYWLMLERPESGVKLYQHEVPEGAYWVMTEDQNQYTGCFRIDYKCTAKVTSAWVAVSTYGGYELLCNGNPVGAQTLWRPTRAFQNGLTEAGQKVKQTAPIIAYNFPREYQWGGHANDRMVTYFDLSKDMRLGLNTLSVEIESRLPQPSVLLYGEIVLATGERIPIRSDTTWKAEPVPKGELQNDWSLPTISVEPWKLAKKKQKKSLRLLYSVVPPKTFSIPAPKQWILADDNGVEREFFTKLNYQEGSGCNIGILTQSPYWLWVNGVLVSSTTPTKKGYNGAEWLVQWEGRRPLSTLPELLDPDEATELFGGERFLNPRHGDPTENNFKQFENTLNKTNERPNHTGDIFIGELTEQKGRQADPYGFLEEPEVTKPLTILRKRAKAEYNVFDLHAVLQEGENEIKLRLLNEQKLGYKGSQSAKFAVTGSPEFLDLEWQHTAGGKVKDVVRGSFLTKAELPKMKFNGGQGGSTSYLPSLLAAMTTFIVFIFVGNRVKSSFLKEWFLLIIMSALAYLLLEICFEERSELVRFKLFSRSNAPGWYCMATASLGLIWSRFGPKFKLLRGSRSGWLCVVLLLICFILRAWKLEFQPIDDDEYASIQAVLSIVENGVPKIADDIWYSRSPMYHYAAALVVKVFGGNIWSLRLYSVILAVVTGWLIWMIGKRYLLNRYIATCALVIFTLHPFLIFSGHIARFYQQQQMFVVLMLHLFIQGFIHGKSIWYRAGAIFVFALATLSQEISISFVPVFGVLYLLFGKGVKFSWDVKAVLYILFAGVLIFADVALFKVKCLTRATGVSPNVEATLAPTFWELGNLFSMFIGYARLHLALSIFYLISLIYSLRRGGRKLITMHLALIISIIAFNFIITSASFRYMYSIIPLWILLGCHGMYIFTHWATVHTGNEKSRSLIGFICLLLVIISFSPWRILTSYNEKILGDSISALAYVRKQLREEDKVMITEPHPHAAKIELGRVDYDLVVPILYDFTYNKDGVLRDRNGDAEVVNRLARLQEVFAKNERVWIIINREKFRSRKKNIRWEYPSAREELFIRLNCTLQFRSYLWSVFLWDRNRGELKTFRSEDNRWIE